MRKRLITLVIMLCLFVAMTSISEAYSLIIGDDYPGYNGEVEIENVTADSTGIVGVGTDYGLVGIGSVAGVLGSIVDETTIYSTKIGVLGTDENANDNHIGTFIGVYGKAEKHRTEDANIGVYGLAFHGVQNYGLKTWTVGGEIGYGVDGYSSNSDGIGFGVYGSAWGSDNIGYGIYGTASNNTVKDYAGFFDGDVHVTGNLTWDSDITLKENIKDIGGVLEKIKKVKVRTYNFKKDNKRNTNKNEVDYGVIAQELVDIFPEMVHETYAPTKRDNQRGNKKEKKTEIIKTMSVDYIKFIPLLLKGLQEQQAEIDNLKSIIYRSGGAK